MEKKKEETTKTFTVIGKPVRLANVATHHGAGVYIGRGTVFGNPFIIGKDGDREQVIAKYRFHLWEALQEKGDLCKAVVGLARADKAVTLKCHCHPRLCHGHVLIGAISWIRKLDAKASMEAGNA